MSYIIRTHLAAETLGCLTSIRTYLAAETLGCLTLLGLLFEGK